MRNIHFLEFTSSSSSAGIFEATFSKVWENGGVWCVLSLSSKKIESERVGNLLKDTAYDLIMNSVEEDRVKLLTEVLDRTQSTLGKILTEESLSTDDTQLSVGVVLIIGSVLYLGKLGRISCFLERDGNILDISKQLSDEEPVVISGKLNEDDKLVITAKKIDWPDKSKEDWKDFSESTGFLIGESENKIDEETIQPDKDSDDLSNPVSTDEAADSDVAENIPVVSDEEGSEKDNFEKSSNPDNSENPLKSKVQRMKQSVFKFGGSSLFPKLKSLFSLIYFKLGQAVSWVGETILGPGRSARYKMPGVDLYKRRRIILIALILFSGFSLYFSVAWLKKKNFESGQVKEYETLRLEIDAILSDAENQSLINKTEALNLLSNVSSQIEKLGSLNVDNNQWQKFVQRKLKIEDKIDNRVRIEKPEVVADLKIWFENANPSDIVYYADSLWMADPEAKAIYKVSADSREAEQVLSAGDGLAQPMCLEIVEDRFYIYDTKKGLLEYDLENNKIKEVTGLSPTNLGNVVEVSSYDSSIYFLVSDSGKILKASPAGSGFSYPQTRLQDESFRNAKDIEINGLIYTLGSGELIRYYVDTRDSQLTISGLNPKLQSADKFELLSSLQVFLLDTENKRIVVLDQPEGSSSVFKLNKQYTVLESEDRYFNELKEIVVAPAERTAYVLDGFRVIKINLDE